MNTHQYTSGDKAYAIELEYAGEGENPHYFKEYTIVEHLEGCHYKVTSDFSTTPFTSMIDDRFFPSKQAAMRAWLNRKMDYMVETMMHLNKL